MLALFYILMIVISFHHVVINTGLVVFLSPSLLYVYLTVRFAVSFPYLNLNARLKRAIITFLILSSVPCPHSTPLFPRISSNFSEFDY